LPSDSAANVKLFVRLASVLPRIESQHSPLACRRFDTFLKAVLVAGSFDKIKNRGGICISAALEIKPRSVRSLENLAVIL
jgi:hypothetical protein